MDSPKEGSKASASKKSAAAAAATAEASLVETLQRFSAAQAEYAQAQHDAQLNAQKQLEETSRTYLEQMRAVSEDSQKRFEEAYRALATSVQEAAGQEDAQARVEEAYRTFVETIRAVVEDIQTRGGGAYRDYTTAVQSGQVSGQQAGYDALRNYLRAMQDAWAQVDVDAVVDASAKGLLGQGA